MYKRILFTDGLPEVSCFILGPRQTGKTSLLSTLTFAIKYDLLQRSEFLKINRDSDLIYREAKKLPTDKKHYIWIDEIQKIPHALDVVHKTIEECKNINFILSGSSARKLRRQGVNLLGGRALDFKFHPLTLHEVGEDFDLETALHFGTLPKVYSLLKDNQSELVRKLLYSYVSIYLEEEIKNEAIVRALEPFQRFLEVAAQCAGTIINFAKIADESSTSHSATTNYFSILEDTLIGFFIPVYHTSIRKQLTKQPKFYFFDNGVNRAILNNLSDPLNGLAKGAMYEQFVIQEIRRMSDYLEKRFKLYFWRTASGAEVDLLICRGQEILLAVECKSSMHIGVRELSGLKSFKEEFPKVPTVICAPVDREQELERGFTIMPLVRLLEVVGEL